MDTLKLSCISVDDEPLALEKINRFIEKVPFLELKKSFSSGLDTIAYLKGNKVDIIFLDIQMEELTGLQVIGLLDYHPAIILTTAYDQYALKGYELDVCDYLLKPFSFERFMKAVSKAAGSISEKTAPPQVIKSETRTPSRAYIFVKTEYRMQKIFLDEILYVEGMKDYLRIMTPKEGIMTLMNFARMMALLPAENFVRVHKSFVVALDKIDSIERERIVINQKYIPIGDTYRQQFFKTIADSGGTQQGKNEEEA
jgi:DNA-binding LytR/AlgR family response regulator